MTVSFAANQTNIPTIATWGFDMADWQVGDLALCVDGQRKPDSVGWRIPPKAGSVFRVTGVAIYKFAQREALALWLEGGPENNSGGPVWGATRFRKITPGADIEGFEEPRRIPVKEPS